MAEREWRVTLHATNGILAGCGLSLRQCPICSALVVEDFMPQHEAWHGAHPVKVDLCECGHPLAEHAESGWGPNTVCVEPLDDENAGWHGVCPCVRHGSSDPPIDPLAGSGGS